MTRRLLRWGVVIFVPPILFLGVLAWLGREGIPVIWKEFREACTVSRIERFSAKLEPVDRIEVLRLEDRDPVSGEKTYTVPLYEPRPMAVAKSVTITGAEAESLAAMWRLLDLEPGGGGNCHDPHHVLRFFKGNRSVVDGVCCFGCGNMALPVFPGHELVSPSNPIVYETFKDRVENLVGRAPKP